MGKYCPITKTKVVYLDCLECDDHVCENPQYPSCSTCRHKSTDVDFLGKLRAVCRLNNGIVDEDEVHMSGCECHNKDFSKENICLNCKHFLGGGDWGLACSNDSYKLPTALSAACDAFSSKLN